MASSQPFMPNAVPRLLFARLGLAVLLSQAALGLPAAHAHPQGASPEWVSSCCGPVTPAGAELARFLDGSGVEQRWLPGWRVDWQTGEALGRWAPGSGPHTHCSAFAASLSAQLDIYLLRPPEHGQRLLANAQAQWLDSHAGRAAGWTAVAGAAAAQTAANRGELVLAVFANPDPRRAGHIAIVRPGYRSAEALREAGPLVTQAGARNALAIPLAQGFGGHPGAWLPEDAGAVRYYAHPVHPAPRI